MTRGHGRRAGTGHEQLVGGLLLATSATVFTAGSPISPEEEALLWSPLLGSPLPAWSLQALLEVEELADLVLVVGPGKETAASELVETLVPGHRTVMVKSSSEPGLAVELGLAELTVRCRLVVIQEASHPLVTPESIRRGIQVAQEHPNCGAIAYVPVKETIKRVEEGVVVGTLPRERLALLQTPQVYPLGLLQSAYASIRGSGPSQEPVADPVTVALSAGVRLVPFAAPGEDILVADSADLGIAQVLLRHRARLEL
jgi:2-C-methyl-D-erythritol 4-phosphate cytidylyltransferase